jgi:Family of unknown function (DUF6252)
MKRVSLFLLFSILFTTFKCDNEPYEGDFFAEEENISCEVASQKTVTAAANFDSATEDNYTELCTAYVEAIENQITACGDADGSLESTVEALGDCAYVIPENGIFQVDFDGQTFIADFASATINNKVINISGKRGTKGETVLLTLFETTSGTYQLGVLNNMAEPNIATYIQGNSNAWESVTDLVDPQGEITITEIDGVNATISGTFNFTGYSPNSSTKEFTNGLFTKIRLNRLPDIFENEFFAKVDSVEYVENSIVLINSFGNIGFGARRNNTEIITISMDENITAGTYDFTFPENPLAEYSLTFTDNHVANGTLTITSHNVSENIIIGTFEFTAEPILTGVGTYEITEGSFSVKYQ